MLSHLDPSIEMTGGPWYTDNELDTEFIKLLSSACLHYVKDRVCLLSTSPTTTYFAYTCYYFQSFPKQKRSNHSSNSQPLYPLSSSPPYPTAQQIQSFLSKSKITETSLNAEHVEMLLNVLILDGEIEKVCIHSSAFSLN